jgi:hypothetical protein
VWGGGKGGSKAKGGEMIQTLVADMNKIKIKKKLISKHTHIQKKD